jgi:cell wall-associated NlpC family hydrolase
MSYESILQEFRAVAIAAYPHEACSLVYVFKGKPRLHVCENVASDTLNDFEIHPNDYFDAECNGEVVGIIHSHPNQSSKPSNVDLISHKSSGLTWWILGLQTLDLSSDMDITVLAAEGELPLVGRSFTHGLVDCFTLIRDYYRQMSGIILPDFVRQDEWWAKGENLYIDNYESAGFYKLPSTEAIKIGDVLLMNIASDTVNHGAIYVGNNNILHHLYHRISCKEVYTGYYHDRTVLKLRFKGN